MFGSNRNINTKFFTSSAIALLSLSVLISTFSESRAFYIPGARSLTKNLFNTINPDGSYSNGPTLFCSEVKVTKMPISLSKFALGCAEVDFVLVSPRFKTENGIEREEKGSFENGIWTVRGVVSWIAPDNKIYGYEYTADDNGYQQKEMPPQDGDNRVDPKTAEGLLGG